MVHRGSSALFGATQRQGNTDQDWVGPEQYDWAPVGCGRHAQGPPYSPFV